MIEIEIYKKENGWVIKMDPDNPSVFEKSYVAKTKEEVLAIVEDFLSKKVEK
jgi:hypothetical protein